MTRRDTRWMAPLAAILFTIALYLPTLRFGFVFDDRPLLLSNPVVRAPAGVVELLTTDLDPHARTGEAPTTNYLRPLFLALAAGLFRLFRPALDRRGRDAAFDPASNLRRRQPSAALGRVPRSRRRHRGLSRLPFGDPRRRRALVPHRSDAAGCVGERSDRGARLPARPLVSGRPLSPPSRPSRRGGAVLARDRDQPHRSRTRGGCSLGDPSTARASSPARLGRGLARADPRDLGVESRVDRDGPLPALAEPRPGLDARTAAAARSRPKGLPHRSLEPRCHRFRNALARRPAAVPQSRDLLGKAVVADPGSSTAWVEWATLRQDAGDLAAAERGIERAIALDDRAQLPRLRRALLALRLGRTGAAVEELEDLVRRNPAYLPAWRNLVARERTRDSLGARSTLDEALRRFPNDAVLWTYRAVLLRNGGRPEEALNALRKASSLSPQEPDLAFQEALLLAEMGRAEEARRIARDGLAFVSSGTESATRSGLESLAR